MTIEQKQRNFKDSVEMLEKLRILINNYFKQNELRKPEEFSQFYLFLLVITCDVNVIRKQYCKIDQRWEEIYLIRQIYTLINESTKKIIGFGKKTEPLNNKEAYWNHKLRIFVEQKYPNLILEFDKISNILINYRNDEFQKELKTLRDLSVHYDANLNTENFFNIFNNTNVNDPFLLFGKWLGIISVLMQFIQKITTVDNSYNKLT